MKPGAIWWHQLGNSLQLIETIAVSLKDCRSAVLRVPRKLPWPQDFYEAVDVRRAAFSAERRLVRLQWEENADPGRYVLENLCTSHTCAEYWPGISCARYLSEKDDILLNQYYVWITGIHSVTDISKWAKFVMEYTRYGGQPENRAVFILEYDGETVDTSGLETVGYVVEKYDCKVFSLEATTDLANSQMREFQAELALCVSGGNPELCYELIAAGELFLRNPVAVASEILESRCVPGGNACPEMDEQQLQSTVWEASIVFLFPILERYRMEFVKKHDKLLNRHLPISNSNGDKVDDPQDLEIGGLYHIVSNDSRNFSKENAEELRLCRKVRNLLAHNKAPSYEDVVNVLKLQ